jgi:hypothetical protein
MTNMPRKITENKKMIHGLELVNGEANLQQLVKQEVILKQMNKINMYNLGENLVQLIQLQLL